jgi:hypothetical protein
MMCLWESSYEANMVKDESLVYREDFYVNNQGNIWTVETMQKLANCSLLLQFCLSGPLLFTVEN